MRTARHVPRTSRRAGVLAGPENAGTYGSGTAMRTMRATGGLTTRRERTQHMVTRASSGCRSLTIDRPAARRIRMARNASVTANSREWHRVQVEIGKLQARQDGVPASIVTDPLIVLRQRVQRCLERRPRLGNRARIRRFSAVAAVQRM